MKGAFNCTHCGACCKKETSPVNITLGDIDRISKFVGKTPEELIGNEIKIRPFLDVDTPGRFELELGLPKPCHFWKDGKCSIYKARPLNCRLFPFWLFAHFTDEEVKLQTLPGYDCISISSVDEEHRKIYREYTKRLGQIIMKESNATDEFIQKGGFQKDIFLNGEEERLSVIMDGPGPDTERVYTELLRKCESELDESVYKELPAAITQEISRLSFASSEDLEIIDLLLEGRYGT